MLGAMTLSPGQLAQLRAINRKYYQRLYTLLREVNGAAGPPGSQSAPGVMPTEREAMKAELAGLGAMQRTDILAMLTPEQRRVLDQE